MPCYDSRNEPDYVRKKAREEFRHNSDVAEMLCTVLTGNPNITFPQEVLDWWKEHQQRDADRKQRL